MFIWRNRSLGYLLALWLLPVLFSPPQRIVSLTHITEMLFAIGAGKQGRYRSGQ